MEISNIIVIVASSNFIEFVTFKLNSIDKAFVIIFYPTIFITGILNERRHNRTFWKEEGGGIDTYGFIYVHRK